MIPRSVPPEVQESCIALGFCPQCGKPHDPNDWWFEDRFSMGGNAMLTLSWAVQIHCGCLNECVTVPGHLVRPNESPQILRGYNAGLPNPWGHRPLAEPGVKYGH